MNKLAEISPISRDFWCRFALYIAILSGYLAVVRDDPTTHFQLAVFTAATVWSLAGEHRFIKPFFSAPIKITLLVTGSFIFAFVIFANFTQTAQNFSNSSARFLLWTSVVFVLSRNKTEYDVWIFAMVELCFFVIASVLIQPVNFLLLFAVGLFSMVYVFVRLAILRGGPAAGRERGALMLSVFQFGLILEVAALVFIGFPRSYFRGAPRKGPQETRKQKPDLGEKEPLTKGGSQPGRIGPGDPNVVDLTSSLGAMKIDQSRALILKVLDSGGARTGQLQYLRGTVMDTYESGRWWCRTERQRAVDADDGRLDGWTRAGTLSVGRGPVVRQQIQILAPGGHDTVYAYGEPVRIQLPEIEYDPNGVLFFCQRPRGSVEYVVESRLPALDDPDLDSVMTSRAPMQYYQLPNHGLVRLRAAAQDVAERPESLRRKVLMLMDYLNKQGLSYKLASFKAERNVDPVDYFLYAKREGYCVHFASALALLCRAASIPARVATGFLVTQPDPESGAYIVKNSDAHAWVEVYFNQHGWIGFDPTPPGQLPAPSSDGEPVATGDTKKKDESKPGQTEPDKSWDAVVRDYDPSSQGNAIEAVVRALGGGFYKVVRFFSHPATIWTLLAFAVAALTGYLILPSARKRRLRQWLGGFRGETTVDFYRDFLWHLSQRGLKKPPGATGWEFAREARKRFSDPGIDLITEKFYQVKYGGGSLSDEDRKRVSDVLLKLERKEDRVITKQ